MNRSDELLDNFYKELDDICCEIEEKVVDIQTDITTNTKKELSISKKKGLFEKLKKGIETMQPNRYLPLIEQIESYKLTKEDQDIIKNVKLQLDNYNYEEAALFLKGNIKNVK